MSFKVLVIGSGKGSNAQALLHAEQVGKLGAAEIIAVLSDRADAPILGLAKGFYKPAQSIPCNPKKARLSTEESKQLLEAIRMHAPDLVVLAGFMKILDAPFIDALGGHIINLHPSLLPSFPGIQSIEQAYNFPVKITGCTVHWVIPKLDAGPIIDQRAVVIESSDTLSSLTEKVHAAEHVLLPDVVRRISHNEISLPSEKSFNE